jgi:hypothetical protein
VRVRRKDASGTHPLAARKDDQKLMSLLPAIRHSPFAIRHSS